jgi:hypothetical protein
MLHLQGSIQIERETQTEQLTRPRACTEFVIVGT